MLLFTRRISTLTGGVLCLAAGAVRGLLSLARGRCGRMAERAQLGLLGLVFQDQPFEHGLRA